ncbi:hypothetical protein [Henriciella marina]|uniref:hypothetical protein n=1 Tax=Henriciella marina TaxID=453851 RepID=UPI0003758402|nr:hypothetical protein [Henriciella marina]
MIAKSFALTAAFASLSVAAEACSCLPPKTVSEKVGGADHVFVGVAEETLRIATEGDERGSSGYVTSFKITQAYKGASGARIYVRHPSEFSSCKVSFEPGEERLVFASDGTDYFPATNACALHGYTRYGQNVRTALEATQSPE